MLKHRNNLDSMYVMLSALSVAELQMVGLTLLYPFSKNR